MTLLFRPNTNFKRAGVHDLFRGFLLERWRDGEPLPVCHGSFWRLSRSGYRPYFSGAAAAAALAKKSEEERGNRLPIEQKSGDDDGRTTEKGVSVCSKSEHSLGVFCALCQCSAQTFCLNTVL